MTKKNKLKKIANLLGNAEDTTSGVFSSFDKGVAEMKAKLKDDINAKTVEQVNDTLAKFRRAIDLDPLISSVNQLKEVLSGSYSEISSIVGQELTNALVALENTREELSSEVARIGTELESLASQNSSNDANVNRLLKEKDSVLRGLLSDVENLTASISGVSADIEELRGELQEDEEKEEDDSLIKEIDAKIAKLRSEMMSSMVRIQGGGNMNRKITFGGVDYLTKYTDINWKAGTNVTLTVAQNDTTKMVDVTVTSTSSGGSVRSIVSISSDTNAGATAGTDYVYLCDGTLTLTLPTAVGNTNLYTIKNVGTGVVTIAPTGAETIDDSPNAVMPVQYTSVDLISDTLNWNVT